MKSEPVPEKAPEFGIFTVDVPVHDFSTLGIEVDATSPEKPMIKELKPGAVTKFNELFPGSSIKVYDVLLAIDGVETWEGKKAKMEAKFGEKLGVKFSLKRSLRKMSLKLHRPKTLSLSIKKTGVSVRKTVIFRPGGLGLKLDYKELRSLSGPKWK